MAIVNDDVVDDTVKHCPGFLPGSVGVYVIIIIIIIIIMTIIANLIFHYHPFRNRNDRWGTTDDFSTSFFHFSLFSTALWDLPNTR